MKIFRTLFLLFVSSAVMVAQTSAPANGVAAPQKPVQAPAQKPSGTTPPDTHAPKNSPKADSAMQDPDAKDAVPAGHDRAAAYYHFTLAHIYEDLAGPGNTDYANKAVQEFKAAIAADPNSEYLNSGLAELYARTGRIREAVVEAQDLLKRDPNNLDAHRLLGRVYLRSLGDTSEGTQSDEMLKLAIGQYEDITRIQPQSADDWLLLGRLYMLNKDVSKAENAFKTAAKADPGSEEALTNLAYLYNEEGNSAKAAQVLTTVPEPTRSAKLYSALGYTYEQQHDSKKAIAAYQKAVDLDGENLDAVRGLAQNLLDDNQPQAALKQYQKIVEEDPQDAQALLRVAEIQRRLGQYDAALSSLNKAESLVQDSLEVPFNKALVYEAQGKYDDAIQTLNILMERTTKATYTEQEANNRTVFLDRLAQVYREANQPDKAIETYQKMIAMGATDSSVRGYQEIIDTYRDEKDFAKATDVAQQAVAKFPQDRNLKLMLAGQLADSGKADEAIALTRGMLKNNADDREVYIGLAQIDSRLKRWKDAEDALAQADKLATKPEDKEYIAFLLGSVYEREKKNDAAEDMFRKVIQADPQNAMALNYLGYMMADRGSKLEEALGLIQKAVQLDPQNGAYLDSLGWAYFKLGNYELAEANLRKAVEKTQNDATVHDHLGDLYQKTGRLRLAAAQWERALTEWARSAPADIDPGDVSKTQKKLESAKTKLARQSASNSTRDQE